MSSLAQISRVKHVFDRHQLVTVINALVRKPRAKISLKLQSEQNFAARINIGTRKFDHITPALRDLRWLPIKQNLLFRDAVMAFKCMTGKAPRYLSDQFTTRIAVTGRETRSCQLLNIPLYKSSAGQRTFYYRMVHIWNDLDSSLKTAKSIPTFKFYLRNKLITDFLNST